MPILLYCLTEAIAPITIPRAGVGEQEVTEVVRSELRCLTSLITGMTGPQISARDSALAFHRVLQDVFDQTAIIPFRFPTTMIDNVALLNYLDEHAADHQETLQRLRNMVQMEIRLSWRGEELQGRKADGEKQTGTEYLRTRQARERELRLVATKLHDSVKSSVARWRERSSSQGVRFFALVPTSSIDDFRRAAGAMAVPAALQARISGPWPATEFLTRDDVGH